MLYTYSCEECRKNGREGYRRCFAHVAPMSDTATKKPLDVCPYFSRYRPKWNFIDTYPSKTAKKRERPRKNRR